MDTDSTLAVRNNMSLATGATMPDEMIVAGADILQREDIAVPRLTLVQATSKGLPSDFLKHVGELYNNITGEYSASIEAVLLGVMKQRVAFPRDFSADATALCASDEGLYARKEFIGTSVTDTKTGQVANIDGICGECPFSKFGADGQTPLCSLGYVYAMMDLETGMPFLLRAQRTGIQAARQLNTVAKMMGRSRSIIVTGKLVSDDKGNYAVPVFSTGKKLAQDIVNVAAGIVRDMGNLAERVSVLEPDHGTNGTAKHDEEDMPF